MGRQKLTRQYLDDQASYYNGSDDSVSTIATTPQQGRTKTHRQYNKATPYTPKEMLDIAIIVQRALHSELDKGRGISRASRYEKTTSKSVYNNSVIMKLGRIHKEYSWEDTLIQPSVVKCAKNYGLELKFMKTWYNSSTTEHESNILQIIFSNGNLVTIPKKHPIQWIIIAVSFMMMAFLIIGGMIL